MKDWEKKARDIGDAVGVAMGSLPEDAEIVITVRNCGYSMYVEGSGKTVLMNGICGMADDIRCAIDCAGKLKKADDGT